MSQLRKSASFRSRIPIRRTKPVPRRCYSPEPYRKRSAMLDQNQNDHLHETKHQEQRNSKLKLKRQRHLASTVAHNQHKPNATSITDNSMASTRPKTIYSSSSYSSSDESQESEAPIQVCSNRIKEKISKIS